MQTSSRIGRPPVPAEQRFWIKVIKTASCWVWIGSRSAFGYGYFTENRKHIYAHRYSYKTMVGPVPAGMHLDHLCRNPSCVRPDHLEPVTPKVNTLRGTGLAAANALKTHCVNGHEFTEANIYHTKKSANRRICRECKRIKALHRWRTRLRNPGAIDFKDRTHCPRGHAYAGENLILRKRGGRECRECVNRLARETRAKRKERSL